MCVLPVAVLLDQLQALSFLLLFVCLMHTEEKYLIFMNEQPSLLSAAISALMCVLLESVSVCQIKLK